MDIGRFFFVRFSFCPATLFLHIYAISKEQHSRLFLHYTPSNDQHQFKQKKKCSACKERNSLFMLSIAHNTHSRYSGICLLGNVVSEKAYRQLNELANKKKKKKKRMTEKRVFFLTQVWADGGDHEKWMNVYIYPRSNRYIILRTDGRYVQ